MIFICRWLIANAGDVPERNSCPVKWLVAFILGTVPTIATISSAKFINRFQGRVYPYNTVWFLLKS